MKYTLICKPGEYFRAGIHALILGSWLPYSRDYVVLQHGVISTEKLNEIVRDGRVSIFYDDRYHVLSIEHYYSQAYYKQMKSDEELQQYKGFLTRVNKRVFKGVLDL